MLWSVAHRIFELKIEEDHKKDRFEWKKTMSQVFFSVKIKVGSVQSHFTHDPL